MVSEESVAISVTVAAHSPQSLGLSVFLALAIRDGVSCCFTLFLIHVSLILNEAEQVTCIGYWDIHFSEVTALFCLISPHFQF